MGILSTILFAAAAVAAGMTILATLRRYASDFVALRLQMLNADTERLIVWRIVETSRAMQNLHASSGLKVRSAATGLKPQGSWAYAPPPSLAA